MSKHPRLSATTFNGLEHALSNPGIFHAWVSKLLLGLMLLLVVGPSLADDEYPIADTELGEYLHTNEVKHASNIAESIESVLRQRYAGETILRDAHPKAHGCLQATFKVLSDIPDHLQQGVFSPNTEYSATVRFSNGNADAGRPDSKGDTRGMAIKLDRVDGYSLSETPDQIGKQDFLLISFPAFFVNEAADYDEFFSIMNSGSMWRMWKLPFLLGWRGSVNAFYMLRTKSHNPLKTRYWSAVPYQLGEGSSRMAVKYSARSCPAFEEPSEASVVSNDDPNFLRAVLADSVANKTACMEFMLQVAPDGASVENVVEEWSEAESAFVPVAQLKFPSQIFDTDHQLQQCERMAFNPWHGVEAHKPLGAVNRIRKLVYDRISILRSDSP